jgi:hypothetical protein
MPVRKLNKSYSSLTGIMPTNKFTEKIQFDSALERDFAYLLEHNATVSHYEVQPLRIEWKSVDGKTKRYTPDFLVVFTDNSGSKTLKPLLCEIKYRNDLKEKWVELKPRFKAAIDYCKIKNWEFKIFTEREIHNEKLYNARFLQNYLNTEFDFNHSVTLKTNLEKLSVSTPEELIAICSNDKYVRAQLLHTLWALVAIGNIGYDNSEKITMQSEIWYK